jgi:hypothetical protein
MLCNQNIAVTANYAILVIREILLKKMSLNKCLHQNAKLGNYLS